MDKILNKANYIQKKREKMGLTQKEFAVLLDMKTSGERTIGGWERGEHTPTEAKWKKIIELPDNAPFKFKGNETFRFIDLFAGIGGIRLPFQDLGGRCVFTSEWDRFAQKTYAANFSELPDGDITEIDAKDIEDHDILLAGFPCQAFSQAGLKKGFNDTRGTMFFEIQRILAEKKPKIFLLENVKQLRGHDKGNTLRTIINILEGNDSVNINYDVPMSTVARKALSARLNYWVDFKVLRAGDFGTPQNRERIFIVGFNKDYFGKDCNFDKIFKWPEPPCSPTRLGNILEEPETIDPKYTISDRLWASHQRRKNEHMNKGNGFGYSLFNEESVYTNTMSARYYKDGSEILIDQSGIDKNPRMLTPRECARLQGFPEEYIVDAASRGQMYKQFGNSVSVNVVKAVANQLLITMGLAEKFKSGEIINYDYINDDAFSQIELPLL
ncbi:DNA (cytosine-5-)-methyltransferase [Porticoccus sp.]|nr:DNA (cytosine-5-)-methyltransferase [Porticoccus sp.]